nr:MAG: hypothetical protein H4Rhizo4523131_000001 [Partitiviridae sp.]
MLAIISQECGAAFTELDVRVSFEYLSTYFMYSRVDTTIGVGETEGTSFHFRGVPFAFRMNKLRKQFFCITVGGTILVNITKKVNFVGVWSNDTLFNV